VIRTALLCALVVVEIDVARAYVTVLLPWPSLWLPLTFLPLIMYLGIGFLLSRRGIEPGTAVRAVATASFADILLGTPLVVVIEQVPVGTIDTRGYVVAVAITVVVNTAVGAAGIWLGSIGRGMPA
jgi:hypothetical protein